MLCWVTPILQPLFPIGAWYYFGFNGNQRQTSHAYGRIRWFKWGLELFYSPIVIDKRSSVKLFLQKERNFLINKMNHSQCLPTDEANWLFHCPFEVEYELLRKRIFQQLQKKKVFDLRKSKSDSESGKNCPLIMNLSCARVLVQHLSQSSQVHMPLPAKTSSTTTWSTTTARREDWTKISINFIYF